MKNIGLLISTLNSGGAERVVSRLSKILSEDYRVHIILFETGFREYEYSGTLHDLDTKASKHATLLKGPLLLKRIYRLRKIIRNEQLECVISFMASPNLVNMLAKKQNCKAVVSIRSFGRDECASVAQNAITKGLGILYKRADKVVTVSKLIEEKMQDKYGIPHERIATIYNPYDPHSIEKEAKEQLSPKEDKFYRGHFVFINVGRIMYPKGIWHLLKAFANVYKNNHQARLVLVGEDYTDGKLNRLIQELGISEAVLQTGRVRNPYKYLAKADVYVLSSLIEGFPNALVEGMICGCAVIAADCKSGPREILYDEPNLATKLTQSEQADYGVIVPELDGVEDWTNGLLTKEEEQLAEAMRKLMENPTLCNRLAKKAQYRASCFSNDRCAQAYKKVIEESD